MALEIRWIEKKTVERFDFAVQRGLKDDCFENENLRFAVFQQFVCMYWQ